jgi:hypothetical protein
MGTRVEHGTRHSSPQRSSRSRTEENSSRNERDRSKTRSSKSRSSRGTSTDHRRSINTRNSHESSSTNLRKSSSTRRRSLPAAPRQSSSSRSRKTDANFKTLNNRSTNSIGKSIPALDIKAVDARVAVARRIITASLDLMTYSTKNESYTTSHHWFEHPSWTRSLKRMQSTWPASWWWFIPSLLLRSSISSCMLRSTWPKMCRADRVWRKCTKQS